MMHFFKSLLLALNIISFIGVIVFGLFGLYEQIMGPADAERLLKRLNIPWSYKKVLIAGFICVGLTIGLFIVRMELFGEI
jgi:hypothetical protein